MNTYIAPIDTDDVQTAVAAVMDDSISEDIAQSVLDNFIEPCSILAPSGCTGEEESQAVQEGLRAQIADNKAEISDYIDSFYAEDEQ